MNMPIGTAILYMCTATGRIIRDKDLLLSVNIIHEHAHRHGDIVHVHSHGPFARHDEHEEEK